MTKQSIVFGLHAVQALLEKKPQRVIHLCVSERSDQKIKSLIELASTHNILIQSSTRESLDHQTQQANHQGIVAVCHPVKSYAEHDLIDLLNHTDKAPLLLILDGIQDPHNLGACLRTADAAGVTAVIAPKDKSVGLTSVAVKVASGAAETVPFIQVTNLARTLRFLKDQNIWIFGAADDAPQSLYQSNLAVPLALVLGSEGTGMRRLTREHCDMLLHIPMKGFVSSLNVSVAAGVFLFETARQRLGV
jgi:23S rRNA (guanosine2251-2'-O)-methyltransferase